MYVEFYDERFKDWSVLYSTDLKMEKCNKHKLEFSLHVRKNHII